MWWKKKEKKQDEQKEEKKEESLLKESCGDDVKLYNFLNRYLYENPLMAISQKDLDVLIEEAEKSGNFGPAVDKAIFEGSQNPGEKERYIKVIQNLASKTIQATEQEKEKAEKAGLTDRSADLEKRIENQKVMSERTEDIIKVATVFYNERLLELGEESRKEEREKERKRVESEEWRKGQLESAEREARKKEISKMSGEEKREAEKQYKREELEEAERKEARAEEKRESQLKEERLEEQEKAEREARRKERGGS
jgi:aspartate beta-hydroxylase